MGDVDDINYITCCETYKTGQGEAQNGVGVGIGKERDENQTKIMGI